MTDLLDQLENDWDGFMESLAEHVIKPAMRGAQSGYEVKIGKYIEWFATRELAEHALRTSSVQPAGDQQ